MLVPVNNSGGSVAAESKYIDQYNSLKKTISSNNERCLDYEKNKLKKKTAEKKPYYSDDDDDDDEDELEEEFDSSDEEKSITCHAKDTIQSDLNANQETLNQLIDLPESSLADDKKCAKKLEPRLVYHSKPSRPNATSKLLTSSVIIKHLANEEKRQMTPLNPFPTKNINSNVAKNGMRLGLYK